jgi:hypothetical protein
MRKETMMNWMGTDHSRLTRRNLIRRTGLAAISGGALFSAKADSVTATSSFANVALPPDIGQANLQVFVEETGHTLRGSFLDYWRANGAASVFGNPITEPFAASNGYYSQAFENVVMQYRPEFLYTHDPIMRLLPLGTIALDRALQSERISWFPAGPATFTLEGLRTAAIPRNEQHPDVVAAIAEGGHFIEESGHTISGKILSWYRMNEGSFYFGAPLTEPYREGSRIVQYFEGGLAILEHDEVVLAPLGLELAGLLEIDTAPVDRNDLPLYDEGLFWTAENPNPLGDPRAPGPKWIQINISQQMLYAYHGDTLISSSLVSTGLPPNQTQRGYFHVRLRFPQQDMAGFTDQTGEVLGFGDAPPGTVAYEVTDVPHILYFSMAAEAIHGAYWHNNFGQKMSHGCVNLPLDMAEWLYGWAPLGTEVWIHE